MDCQFKVVIYLDGIIKFEILDPPSIKTFCMSQCGEGIMEKVSLEDCMQYTL